LVQGQRGQHSRRDPGRSLSSARGVSFGRRSIAPTWTSAGLLQTISHVKDES
jgi:hypothetical protein